MKVMYVPTKVKPILRQIISQINQIEDYSHYEICCENQIIDVASVDTPIIEKMVTVQNHEQLRLRSRTIIFAQNNLS